MVQVVNGTSLICLIEGDSIQKKHRKAFYLNNINFKELDKAVLFNYTWEEFFLINNIPYEIDGKENGKQKYRVIPDDFPEFVGINGTNTGVGSKKRLSFKDSTKTGVDWADDQTAKNGNKRTFNIIQAHAIRNNITKGQASLDLAEKKGLPIPREGTVNRETLFEKHCNNDIKALNRPENKDILEYLLDRGLLKIDPDSGRIINNNIGYNTYYKKITFIYHDQKGKAVYASYRQLPEELFKSKYPDSDYKEYSKYGKYGHPNPNVYEEGILNKEVPFNYYYSCKYSNSTEIYITEGIPDSQTLLINGKNNLCMGSVSVSGNVWNNYFIPVLENYKNKTIVFLGDNDDRGKNAVANWILTYLIPNGYTNVYVEVIPRTDAELFSNDPYSSHFLIDDDVKTLYPKGSLKDVNELYMQDNNLINELSRTRIHAYSYLAMHYKNKYNDRAFNKFKNEIIRPNYCNLKQYEIDLILSDLDKYNVFEEEEILSLEKYVNNSPSQNEIVENIKSKYDLLYNPSTGFYLFNGKVWELAKDPQIEMLISEELGNRFRDGNKIKPVLRLLKCDRNIFTSDVEFNKNDVLVFNNGTLYLKDTKEDTYFKENEFNPKDRVTFLFEFDYNPRATCEKWNNFLNGTLEVRDLNGVRNETDTQTKIKMLQDFSGYILYSDYSLEFFMIFLGNGGNGKNVVFETIARILPHNAVGYKPVTQFKERHAMSFFKDKMLNISGEAKGSLYGNETNIKDLTSGSEITDDPKFKDEITFRNRAKLIICGNEDFKIEDKSDGFTRRILFIEFANTYTNDERYLKRNNPKYQKIDIDLKKQLPKEDSGIFNWMLEGYFRLKKNKKFIVSEEHKKLMERFKRSNNLVRDYILNEKVFRFDSNDTCYKADLDTMFTNFKIFCESYNTKSGTIATFSKNLRNTLNDLGIEFTAKRERCSYDNERFTTRFFLDCDNYDHLIELAEEEY